MSAFYDPATARMAERNIFGHLLRTGGAVLELFGIRSQPELAREVATSPSEVRIAELAEAVKRQKEGEQG